MFEKVIAKLLSGKFLFTVITAIVFAYMSITGKLTSDKVTEIILLVLYAYFTRKTNDGTPTT